MAAKRGPGAAQVEERIIQEWKRYAARQAGDAQRVASGACYLEARPCAFEPRPDFETRFLQDCVHCARLQAAIERHAPAPAGSSGVLPTLPLLLRLVEQEGSDRGAAAATQEEDRSRTAAVLFRGLPLLHAALDPERVARLLLSAIATGFPETVDTLLFLRVTPDAAGLSLAAAFRRADLEGPLPALASVLDLEALEAGEGFDGAAFDGLREQAFPLSEDRDLLADAVLDGRTAVVPNPERELRLPTLLVDHLPPGPAAILPVFGRDRVIGVLVVSAAPGTAGWEGEPMELLGAIAAQAGIALEANSLLDLARRRGATLPALLQGAQAIAEPGTDARRRAEVALHTLRAATYARGGVAWSRDEGGALEVAATSGLDPADTHDLAAAGQALLQWIEADTRPTAIAGPSEDPRLAGSVPDEWRTALVTPLLEEGRVTGAVLVCDKAGTGPGGIQPFDAEDAHVGELWQRIASLATNRVAHAETMRARDRRVEELEAQLRHAEKLAVVGERSIQMAQDIRTPAAAITSFARRVLRALSAEDPNREYLEVIAKEGERLERLLGEQVALAQLTQPRLKLENVNTLVQSALEGQSEELVRRRVRLLKRLAPDVPPLLIDAEKMRQVLNNILSYALQSVPSGGRLRVETRLAPGVAQIEIAHDGPKSAGEVLDRLFVPFSASRRAGAGIGLAMAYQIVREHGGEIRARSEGDWTSIVTVFLPVRENQDRRRKPDRRGGRSERRRRLA